MVHILILEDDPQFRKLLARILLEDGYNVETACNGKDGLRIFNANPADVVITDILMPEMDGIEVIRRLAKHHTKPKFLAISGGSYNMPARLNLDVAALLGVSRTLAKPFSPVEFKSAVFQMLQ
jgi:CheY-like chemotaxis protein